MKRYLSSRGSLSIPNMSLIDSENSSLDCAGSRRSQAYLEYQLVSFTRKLEYGSSTLDSLILRTIDQCSDFPDERPSLPRRLRA